MARKRIIMNGAGAAFEPLHQEEDEIKGFRISNFLELHKQFMTVKKLEGLAEKTLEDHVTFMRYFSDWMKDDVKDYDNRFVEKGIFLEYVAYMYSKDYKPCTMNLRLRTLKCYLRWLFNEKIIDEDISNRIKLVKVPKDTKEPLTPQEIKKIFKVLNLSDYSHYRDFGIMLAILDCGIRINELINVSIDDYNPKEKTIRIGSLTAKTRETRILPISSKTAKHLQKLIDIAKSNHEEYIFNSSYGGKIASLNVIKNFEKYGKQAGIKNKQTTPHQYRRTFAVECVKAGMDIFTLQKMLGHANIATTRIYVNLDNSHLIENHNKIDIISKFI